MSATDTIEHRAWNNWGSRGRVGRNHPHRVGGLARGRGDMSRCAAAHSGWRPVEARLPRAGRGRQRRGAVRAAHRHRTRRDLAPPDGAGPVRGAGSFVGACPEALPLDDPLRARDLRAQLRAVDRHPRSHDIPQCRQGLLHTTVSIVSSSTPRTRLSSPSSSRSSSARHSSASSASRCCACSQIRSSSRR